MALLRVILKPRSSYTRILAVDRLGSNTTCTVAVRAPARDGLANTELVRYLCEVLSASKADVQILKGLKSKEKFVKVSEKGEGDILRALRARVQKNINGD